MQLFIGESCEQCFFSRDDVLLSHWVSVQQMTLFIGLCTIAFLAAVVSGDHTSVYVCVHVSVPGAQGLGLRATALVLHRSILAQSLAPCQSCASPAILSSPPLVLVETGNRGWTGRERDVTIWQENRPDLDLLRKRTGISATRMFKQLLCIF